MSGRNVGKLVKKYDQIIYKNVGKLRKCWVGIVENFFIRVVLI